VASLIQCRGSSALYFERKKRDRVRQRELERERRASERKKSDSKEKKEEGEERGVMLERMREPEE
jgi:hypothetical protein